MFNRNSRLKNVLMASAASVGYQLIKIALTFVYRTIFLMVFSKEYLGINGLFTNILQILSLAELGVGTAIVYRMYKPFAQEDVEQIAALLQFYKTVYRIIALVVVVFSIGMYQLLPVLVNMEEIPPDVNVTVVYFLFVAQSVVSYFAAYKQSVITADQRGYMVSLYQMATELTVNLIRIALVFISRNYVVVLAGGIVVTAAFNLGFGAYISSQYREIFQVHAKLDKKSMKQILSDTASLLCHKVGSVAVSATGNMVLAKFVSLVSVGLYSNYAMITNAVMGMMSSAAGSINSIVGNYATVNSKEETYKLYLYCVHGCFWLVSCLTICLCNLFNVFVEAWLDASYLFDQTVVLVICVQFFVMCSRLVNNIFINGCGLFALDRVRPLIEAAINLIVSIALVQNYGIVGVFVGGVVSGVLTYYWREPYLLLYRYFGKNFKDYIPIVLLWISITIVSGVVFGKITGFLPAGWWGFFLRGIVTFVGTNLLYALLMCRTKFFGYFVGILKTKMKR